MATSEPEVQIVLPVPDYRHHKHIIFTFGVIQLQSYRQRGHITYRHSIIMMKWEPGSTV